MSHNAQDGQVQIVSGGPLDRPASSGKTRELFESEADPNIARAASRGRPYVPHWRVPLHRQDYAVTRPAGLRNVRHTQDQAFRQHSHVICRPSDRMPDPPSHHNRGGARHGACHIRNMREKRGGSPPVANNAPARARGRMKEAEGDCGDIHGMHARTSAGSKPGNMWRGIVSESALAARLSERTTCVEERRRPIQRGRSAVCSNGGHMSERC